MASYYLNAKNQYGVRFYVTENGVRKHKNLSPFATKKQAEDAYLKYMLAVNVTANLPYHGVRLKDVALRYFQNNENKESSNVDALAIYHNFIAPIFGEWYIDDIKKRDLLVWQTIVTKMGYSYPYKKKIRSRFNQILEYANERYDYPNPFPNVKPFKKSNKIQKEIEVIDFEEFTDLINAVSGEVYRLYFTLLYYTGLRPKEALALMWSDIDFKNLTLRVNKTLTRKVTKEDRDNGISYKITPPKTASSNRTIAISNRLRDTLYEYYQANKNESFIFARKGKPLAEISIQRALTNACEKAKINKKITPHVFRHTHASTLIDKGLPIVAVADRLGHDDITTTLKTYAHSFNKIDRRASDIFDSL